MEVTIVDQNSQRPESPPSEAALTLDGQRSELLLPPVSKLAHDNPQNYGQSWDKCLVMFEKHEGQSFNSETENSGIEDTKANQTYLHISQGYNPGYSIEAKQQGGNNDEAVFKGSNDVNSRVFYSSQGSKTKNSSEYGNQVPDETRSSGINNRIHKASVARQDSVAFDITLDSPNEAIHKDLTETKNHGGNRQSTQYKNNLTKLHHGQQVKSPNPSDGHRQNLTTQNLPPNAKLTPGAVSGNMHGKHQVSSKSFADSEWVFSDETSQETCNHAASDQAGNQVQSDKKYAKSYHVADIDNANEPKSTDYKKENYSFDKERETLRTLQFLLYAMFFAMIVLIMMLVHLNTRVTALESSGGSSSTTICQCDETIVTLKDLLVDKINQANNGIADSNNRDTLEQILTYFHQGIPVPSADGETAKLFIDPEGNKNMQSNQKHGTLKASERKNKSIDKIHTGIPSLARHVKSKNTITNLSTDILNLADSNATHQSLSTDKNNPEKAQAMHNYTDNFRTMETTSKTNGTFRVELADFTTDTTDGQPVSRHKRAPRREKDKNFTEKIRLKNQKQQNKEGRNTSPQVENFHVPYFELFHYPQYFMSQDPLSKHMGCTTNHPWGHGIEACKDSRVIFPEKHSFLPFYRPTNTTAEKDVKKRLINIDTGGRFHVNVSGDYLFQQNITLLADSESHYLALYLNGQATLACQHGGFVCPHTNDDNSSKFKVCIITGVLELKKDDIVDIRTMDSHMTVRAEVHHLRKSHIKFILLNRTK